MAIANMGCISPGQAILIDDSTNLTISQGAVNTSVIWQGVHGRSDEQIGLFDDDRTTLYMPIKISPVKAMNWDPIKAS